MKTLRTFTGIAAVSATALCVQPAQADDQDVQKLIDRVGQLEKELHRLKSTDQQDWLSKRESEEVKDLVADVLADAELRTSMQGDNVSAGHDGKKFFLADPGGNFLLNVGGQIQFRHITALQDDPATVEDGDEADAGFQLRRTKVGFSGHTTYGEQKFKYKIVLAMDRGDGNIFAEDVIVSTKVDALGGADVSFGLFKIPFLREELNSSSRLQTVELSSVTEFFTANRAEQIQVAFGGKEPYEWAAKISIHDGANSGNSEFNGDTVEFGVAARIDVAIAGSLKQIKDFSAWEGEDTGIFVGAAVLYQAGDGANGAGATAMGDYLGWTIDASIESNGMNLFAAIMGGSTDKLATDRDMFGFVIQGGIFIVPDEVEPFARFEYIDGDTAADEASALTLGVNWYQKKHAAKFTADVVLFLDGDEPSTNPFGASEFSGGLGLANFNSADDEIGIAIRLQYQLLF